MAAHNDTTLKTRWSRWLVSPPSEKTTVDVVKAALWQHRSRSILRLWDAFDPQAEFSKLFHQALSISANKSTSLLQRTCCVDFIRLCFESIEVQFVRKEISRIVSISIWSNLSSPSKISFEISKAPIFGKMWRANLRKLERANEEEKKVLIFEQSWVSNIIQELYLIYPKNMKNINNIEEEKISINNNNNMDFDVDVDDNCEVNNNNFYIENCTFVSQVLRLLVLLECQLFSRRFVHCLLEDHQILNFFHQNRAAIITITNTFTKEKNNNNNNNNTFISSKTDEDKLLTKKHMIKNKMMKNIQDYIYWLDFLIIYYLFPIDEHTGKLLTLEQHEQSQEEKILLFQTIVFKQFKDEMPDIVTANLSKLQNREFLESLFLEVETNTLKTLAAEHLNLRIFNFDGSDMTHEQISEMLTFHFSKLESPLSTFQYLPIYPLDCSTSFIDKVLPPLSLQYISTSDYLLRHCAIYRRECRHTLNEYIEECITRLRPCWENETGQIGFDGHCRMAVPIQECSISRVGSLAAFDSSPSRVEAEVRIDLQSVRRNVSAEWDRLCKGEVVFLVTIQVDKDIPGSKKIIRIRGATVDEVLGYNGLPVNNQRNTEEEDNKMTESFGRRVFKLLLDRHQFAIDRQSDLSTVILYSSFNIIIRRNRRENNFWSTIRAILDTYETQYNLPEWLREAFLGYGDPMETHYSRIGKDTELYFHDTFVSREHLETCFPKLRYEFTEKSTNSIILDFSEDVVLVKRKPGFLKDPFTPTILPENKIKFTTSQVEAIRSGSSRGLTLIIGPPGTGKTDVTVQILSNLYHGRVGERILLLTHGNQALNQLFEKLLQLNHIPEHHLLRLGHADDEVSKYDKYGRVTHFMERRSKLLYRIDILSRAMKIAGDHSFSCETAVAFFKIYVQSAWEKYWKKYNKSREMLVLNFPFTEFFKTMYPEIKIFPETESSIEEFQEAAQTAWRNLEGLLLELKQSQPLEVLKRDSEKANFLLSSEARIVAMTTTYASIKRKDLLELGFEFDSLIMEEAGTVMEIEAFVPLSLSKRLKRVVLIGDHQQLPPVVQCPELHSLAESLFVRFIRLGAPQILLDQQGRTRTGICKLYQHVYPKLTHLPQVSLMAKRGNAGFHYEYQFIDVGDYQGVGETQPAPHHFQNLGEAEYVVAVYIYMRHLGYLKESIVVLTTYNGQKELIREVMKRRCAWNSNPFEPCHVTTVDKYQGQQCDYVILSLVRTRQIGHFGDIRRLVVAMSRARLGLYIFGRYSLYASCSDLTLTFKELSTRPRNLTLVLGEHSFNIKRCVDEKVPSNIILEVKNIEEMASVLMNLEEQEKMDTL